MAEQYVRRAMSESTRSTDGVGAARKTAFALTSIAASLVQASKLSAELDATDPDYVTGTQLNAVRVTLAQAASDQPDHYVRWAIAFLRGEELPPITPEEPEPGRDWSRVAAHVFMPTGKWKYQVFLDYTEMRHGWRGSGEGPSGWHFDGEAMAREALQLATERGTSGVTFDELPPDWHMFVQNPPQGYPFWVHGRDWEFEPNVGWHPPTYPHCANAEELGDE